MKCKQVLGTLKRFPTFSSAWKRGGAQGGFCRDPHQQAWEGEEEEEEEEGGKKRRRFEGAYSVAVPSRHRLWLAFSAP